jgi:hypothetical protein
MAERDRAQDQEKRQEQGDDIPGLTRENTDIGTGLGGGLAPVLPTDIDGENPDANWLASSKDDTALPNWIAAEELPEGLERKDAREPVQLPRDAHIITVFGDNLGKVTELYGYSPTNEPAWAAVLDGGRKMMVPLMSGQIDEDGIHVPYPKELIESAPALPEHELSVADEMVLYGHYNERRILPASSGTEEERTLHLLDRAA